MTILKGYLTYLLAAVAIIWGLVGWSFGWIDQDSAMKTIWIGLVAFGVRRALPK